MEQFHSILIRIRIKDSYPNETKANLKIHKINLRLLRFNETH